MRIGLALQYFTAPIPPELGETVTTAERIGYESVWVGESYGSDAFTPLAFLAGRTETMRLGTSVAQIPARPPTSAAMAAMTLDHLSRGRAVLGLGPSGPQVAEGWYGEPFGQTAQRVREYVDVVRQVFARRQPVAIDGELYQLPLPASALAKPLKANLPPLRVDLPVHLAAEGPRMISLAAEVADGWHGLFYSPEADGWYAERLQDGFAVRGGRPAGFEVMTTAHVSVDDDVEVAADRLRPLLALYIGGMGARGANFHNDVFARRGWEGVAAKVQELYLDGQRADAVASVPTALVEEVSLIGPLAKIRDEAARWRETIVDTLALVVPPSQLAPVFHAVSA